MPDHGRYTPIHCFLGVTSIPSRVFSLFCSPTSVQKLFNNRSQSWKFSVGSQLRTREFRSHCKGDGVVRCRTCSHHRRNHTTVFEGELDMIVVTRMNDEPSQDIPGWILVHISCTGKGERGTYPFAFGLPSGHNNLCRSSMKFKDKRDGRADLPTEYWTSSGGLGGNDVCLFFRLPIIVGTKITKTRREWSIRSPFLYPRPTI